jgi:hypothetical protein
MISKGKIIHDGFDSSFSIVLKWGLAVLLRLASNSRFSFLSLQIAGITGVCHCLWLDSGFDISGDVKRW